MSRLVLQFVILIGTFFGTWFAFRQFDWMSILQVEKVEESIEAKLGDLYWDLFKQMEEEETDESIINPVDTLLTTLCLRNHIDRDKIKLHIIDKDEINAFALPDHHMVIFTGLIDDCLDESELTGVIAHELAHMENGHIMRKLVKEIGLSVLVSMAAGNAGPEIMQEAVRVLSSTAYDRNLERDADQTGVTYLIQTGVNPEGFANFLFRISETEKELPKQIFWLATHPGSEERARNIISQIEGMTFEHQQILTDQQWDQLKERLSGKLDF